MGYNILIVDDSDVTRQIIKKTIGMSDIKINTIFEAVNGREALERLQEEWIDIVLTDINMPEMDGVELIRQMSQDNMTKKMPVVIVSTERSKTRIDDLMSMGVRAYLTKPFRPEEFRSILVKLLGEQHKE